jgi:hypothetical protein
VAVLYPVDVEVLEGISVLTWENTLSTEAESFIVIHKPFLCNLSGTTISSLRNFNALPEVWDS